MYFMICIYFFLLCPWIALTVLRISGLGRGGNYGSRNAACVLRIASHPAGLRGAISIASCGGERLSVGCSLGLKNPNQLHL